MANIINWPESQVCIGCVHSLFVMLSEPAQYICELDLCGGSECNNQEDPVVEIVSAYEWHCPQCLEWNEFGHDYPMEDYVQCGECDSEFRYE